MMNVAICEEDQKIRDQIIKHVSETEGITFCKGYICPAELIQALAFGREYPLILMSMDWPDGHDSRWLEAARKIQEICPNTKLIYMTERPGQYVQQIFLEPINRFGFLLKPIREEILKRYIQKALTEENSHTKTNDSILIRKKGGIHSIRFEEILYMESAGHTVEVRTRTDNHSCYGRLEKFLEILPEYFVQCHKSYLVNMKEICHLERNCISMRHGEQIPVSKSRYGDTRKRYFHYMEGILASGKDREKEK